MLKGLKSGELRKKIHRPAVGFLFGINFLRFAIDAFHGSHFAHIFCHASKGKHHDSAAFAMKE